MEWLKVPNDNMVNPEGFCYVRVCDDKTACDGYQCVILLCGSNA